MIASSGPLDTPSGGVVGQCIFSSGGDGVDELAVFGDVTAGVEISQSPCDRFARSRPIGFHAVGRVPGEGFRWFAAGVSV